jgi:hypothetical protein
VTPETKLTKWEYQGFAAGSEGGLLEHLNEAGEEGWELVGVFPQVNRGTTTWIAFLKRPSTGQPPKPAVPDTAKMLASKSAAKKPAKADDQGFDLQP